MSLDIVVVALARTPFGRFQGILKSIDGPHLGALAIDEVLVRSKIAPEDIDALYGGKDSVYTETEVTYEDGRKGRIKATLEIRDAAVVARERRMAAE